MTERAVVPTAAREWLEQYADTHPSLKEALADDAVQRRAGALTRLWVRTFEQRVYDLRGSPAIVAQRNLSQLHRTATEMMRALVMRHDTFSVFLSEVRACRLPMRAVAWLAARAMRSVRFFARVSRRLSTKQAVGRPAALADVHDSCVSGVLSAARQHLVRASEMAPARACMLDAHAPRVCCKGCIMRRPMSAVVCSASS